MTIIYQVNTMATLFNSDAILDECVALARSAMGADKGYVDADNKRLLTTYRDTLNLYTVTARDDAASNKLVGTFGFGDVSQYPMLSREYTPPEASLANLKKDTTDTVSYNWVRRMLNVIDGKGLSSSTVDAATSIYVHADYKNQRIGTTMMARRATFQINRGVTHAVSFLYETTEIKTWSATRTSAEEITVDDDSDPVYLFDLRELT